ncbi:MAG: MBL fold metallo-hydrolase [Anaerolineae bacterium]|nr:MBL fold metallo-hydrolase [Anaerolineae bacterium]
MKITFHGAALTTTGSMHLIETDHHRILLDCGLYQGKRAEAFARNANPPFDSTSISHVILSHAHIDHAGNVPTLVKRGYAGEIHCTTATRDLATLMLRDSAHIQEQDAAYLNQKTSRRGLPPVEPLYTTSDVEVALRHFVGYAYDKWFDLDSVGRAILYDAGHILGSAITVLELEEGARTYRIGFSGDLGRTHAPILRDPATITNIDYLIIESTYGDREHPSFEQAADELARLVRATIERGGKVIIPAFAVGRTQELLYFLHQHIKAGDIPRVPIFVDSPLAIDATDVFRLHLECFDDETHELLLDHQDPFGFGELEYTRTVEQSRALNELKTPAIIIAASGMCEAGRILHHLKHNIEDARNTILFVGYQAENTLGRRLVDGIKRVKIFGDEFTVRAQVVMLEGFSAHADRRELLAWVAATRASLRGVFVVHGDAARTQALADALRTLGDFAVTIPTPGQTVEL